MLLHVIVSLLLLFLVLCSFCLLEIERRLLKKINLQIAGFVSFSFLVYLSLFFSWISFPTHSLTHTPHATETSVGLTSK